jgi:topoisomerase IA-like protein
MEDLLDKIALGTASYVDTVRNFYTNLRTSIAALPPVTATTAPKVSSDARVIDLGRGYSTCQVRTTKYGPVIQYGADTKPRYVNITSFLKLANKEMKDLDANDAKFLLSFPKALNDSHTLLFGPYGLYVQNQSTKQNLKVFDNEYQDIRNGDLASLMQRLGLDS